VTDPASSEGEDGLRTEGARVVQTLRRHLRAGNVPPEIIALREPVEELAGLLEADAPVELLEEAAQAVVDFYDWPSPDSSEGGEGPAIDAQILGAIERLRDAIDALDALDGDT
jgi:hypothetical protein